MNGRRAALAASAGALGLALLVVVLAWPGRVASSESSSSPRPGAVLRAGVSEWLEIPSPDVEFETLEGGTVRLAEFRGRIVILNFWGTWCPPCLREIPELIEVQRVLKDFDATVLGPAIDSGSPEDIRGFATEHGINYPVVISGYKVSVGEFGAAGYPFSLLIDEEGVIRRRYLGPQTARTLLRDFAALVIDGDVSHGS
jgi:peroxiredoxin